MKVLNVYRICFWLTVVLIWILALWGCEEEPIPKKLSTIHIWDEECKKEIIGTYFTDDGFWFQCVCCGNVYKNKRWLKAGRGKYGELDWEGDEILKQMEHGHKVYILK